MRTLERRLAAVCRAVAVRVAEGEYAARVDKPDSTQSDRHVITGAEPASHDATTTAHPPEMPIVIDEAAVEDILGVISA